MIRTSRKEFGALDTIYPLTHSIWSFKMQFLPGHFIALGNREGCSLLKTGSEQNTEPQRKARRESSLHQPVARRQQLLDKNEDKRWAFVSLGWRGGNTAASFSLWGLGFGVSFTVFEKCEQMILLAFRYHAKRWRGQTTKITPASTQIPIKYKWVCRWPFTQSASINRAPSGSSVKPALCLVPGVVESKCLQTVEPHPVYFQQGVSSTDAFSLGRTKVLLSIVVPVLLHHKDLLPG